MRQNVVTLKRTGGRPPVLRLVVGSVFAHRCIGHRDWTTLRMFVFRRV